MKKNHSRNVNCRKNFTLTRFLVLFVILGASMLPLSASSLAQNDARVSISYKNARLETVLRQITRLTDIKFVYNNARISTADKVSIEAQDVELDQLLNKILGDKFNWQRVDNYIVISARQANNTPGNNAPSTPQTNEMEVSGKVVSTTGETLIGVSVVVKGTTTGVATDVNGRFNLKVPRNTTLVFSYIGYITKEVPATGKMQVTLEEDQQELDEVMVVAYGTARKSSFTGSAAVVKKDVLEKSQVSSLSKALQGVSAGVQANSASGQPGTDADIRIRGIGSINASSSPLYVVDGVPYDGSLNSINPADIESMTVLKDAASSALYGSRGANGVIVITTKQGSKEAEPVIDFRLSYGISDRAVKDYEHVSTDQYFELMWEALRNYRLDNNYSETDAAAYASQNLISRLGINPYGSSYAQPVGSDGRIVAGAKALWNDDWEDALSQNARRMEIQLSAQGGTKNTKYFISGGYLDDQGIALASGFKRYTGRVNLTSDLKKWITIGGNISVTHSEQDYPVSSDSKTSNVINFGRLLPSFYPIYQRDGEGNYLLENGEKQIDWGSYRPSSAMRNMNLVGSLPHDKNEIKRDAATIRTFLELTLYKGLKFKTSLNIDYNNRNEHYYTNPVYGTGTATGGDVTKQNYRTTGMTFNNILTYNNTFKEVHSINALLGQEYYEYNSSSQSGSRQNFIMMGYDEPDAASQLIDFSGSSDQYKLLSYFANFEYAYNQRYFISASARTDGSSRFHPDNRWGTFWSVGASWKAIEEDFLKEVKWLSNLTLRASYGAQGNDNLGSYYAYKSYYTVYNNLGESGVVTSRLATPDLKWESNLNLNIGLDAAFFAHRLSATIEFFDRRSKDLLFAMPMAGSTGFTSVDRNIGALKNVGWEFSFNGTPIKTRDWTWDLSFNATTYKNKITKLPQEEIISGNKRMVVGGSVYDFYLVEWAGVNPETGAPQWYKTNANGERVITETYSEASTSKITAGSALPDLQGGFSTRLAFRNFELSGRFAYTIGGKIYNQDKLFLLHNGSSAGRAWSTEMLNRWTPENRNTDVPRLSTVSNSWTSTSTRFLYDGTYLRMKNLMFSYDLPAQWINKIHLNSVKLYFQAENLFTIYKEEGLDPEQALNGTTYFRYPAMRTFSFGINIKL